MSRAKALAFVLRGHSAPTTEVNSANCNTKSCPDYLAQPSLISSSGGPRREESKPRPEPRGEGALARRGDMSRAYRGPKSNVAEGGAPSGAGSTAVKAEGRVALISFQAPPGRLAVPRCESTMNETG